MNGLKINVNLMSYWQQASEAVEKLLWEANIWFLYRMPSVLESTEIEKEGRREGPLSGYLQTQS